MKTMSTFIITLLLFSFLFIAANNVEAQQQQLCCQNTPDTCTDNAGGTIPIKCINEEAVRFGEECNIDTGRCQFEPRDVPTLSEWGLIAMAGVLGLVGFMVMRRKRATA